MNTEIGVCAVRSSTISVTARGVDDCEACDTALTRVDSANTAMVSIDEPRMVRICSSAPWSMVNGSLSGTKRAM